jgi:hypothetical protein
MSPAVVMGESALNAADAVVAPVPPDEIASAVPRVSDDAAIVLEPAIGPYNVEATTVFDPRSGP